MSKIVRVPVRVILNENGFPAKFFWKGRWFVVESMEDIWPYTGKWWEGESKKIYFRIYADGSLFEILTDGSGKWWLHKIYE